MQVILHNIRSIQNVGSIFRTADAAGIEKLYLAGITPAPVDRVGNWRSKFVKISLGAEKHVAWEKIVSTVHLLESLKRQGYNLYAVEQHRTALPYYKMVISKERQKRTTLLFGNELHGISPAILRRCDKVLEIPMKGKKESLNVSIAFGIVVFHLIYG